MTGGTSMAAADTPIPDPVGAFCAHGWYNMRPVGAGPLAGWTFGVKDLFDVAGLPTGAGSPEWLRTHPRPSRTAPAVQRLLDAGATLLGKTQTDELAWSLNGQNAHYGTPINAAAPERIPGGSSSGSAAAVAAGVSRSRVRSRSRQASTPSAGSRARRRGSRRWGGYCWRTLRRPRLRRGC